MNVSSGPHSAIAIQRQRRLREKKKRERRHSSRANSTGSIGLSSRIVSSRPPSGKRMLHTGATFLVLGLFMICIGFLSDVMTTGSWQMELVVVGILVVVVGIFLIILYPFMFLCTEENFKQNDKQIEHGYSGTKHFVKDIEKENENENMECLVTYSSPKKNLYQSSKQNGDVNLERIVEEDVSEETDHTKLEKSISNNSAASSSSGLPVELLVMNGRQDSFNSRQY